MKKIVILFLVLLSLPLIFAATQEERKEYQSCSTDCSEIKKEARNVCMLDNTQCNLDCSGNSSCKSICSKEKNACLKQTGVDYRACKLECKDILAPKCLNGTYVAGETFEDGCSVCKCMPSGKVSCKKEAFCNKDANVSKENCESSGGFYQSLCGGPYFGILCSKQEFCICGGINNYSCPDSHQCLTDFVSPIRKSKMSQGWKDLIGNQLGDIGVCVQ